MDNSSNLNLMNEILMNGMLNFVGSEKPKDPKIGDVSGSGTTDTTVFNGDKWMPLCVDYKDSISYPTTPTFKSIKCENCHGDLEIPDSSVEYIVCPYCGSKYYNTNYVKLEKR